MKEKPRDTLAESRRKGKRVQNARRQRQDQSKVKKQIEQERREGKCTEWIEEKRTIRTMREEEGKEKGYGKSLGIL